MIGGSPDADMQPVVQSRIGGSPDGGRQQRSSGVWGDRPMHVLNT